MFWLEGEMKSIVGTPRWLFLFYFYLFLFYFHVFRSAPEIYSNDIDLNEEFFSIYDQKASPYTEKSDVYSFGVILWEIVAREVKKNFFFFHFFFFLFFFFKDSFQWNETKRYHQASKKNKYLKKI